MPRLRHATTAGEMLAPEVFKKFTEQTGIPLREGYGQTETVLIMANFLGQEPWQVPWEQLPRFTRLSLWIKMGIRCPMGRLARL